MITTANKRDGYILMEIIISIMILSIVGIALLKVSSNEKRLYTIASGKLEFLRYLSIPLDSHSINLHGKELVLYDLVKNRYELKNDFLIKELKKIKINYTQKYKSIINITEEKNGINILIDEITVKNQNGTAKFLTVKE